MPVVEMAAQLQKCEDELAQVRELVSVDDPEMAAEARAEQGASRADHRRARGAAHAAAAPARSARRPQRDRRDPRRHRRRRGGAVRRRPATACTRATASGTAGASRSCRCPRRRSAASKKSYSRFLVTAPYGAMRWESGVHRVQRVPATESAGTHPHLRRHRRRAPRGRGGRRQDRGQGSSHRRLPRRRARAGRA